MVESISARVSAVKAGGEGGDGFCVVPILGPSHDEPGYRMLEEEILDAVKGTETSSSGSVTELLIENTLDVSVFLIDGQEVLGVKQNRILNTDVLVPAKTKLHLPVSCVEQGRWHDETPQFSPGKSAPYRTRRGKAERVHDSLRSDGRHNADQSAVWREVDEELTIARCASPTAALSDAYKTRQKQLDDMRKQFTLPDEGVGVAVFYDGTFKGLDLFDRHSTLVYFWESLVDSYAIDWLHRPAHRRRGKQEPKSDSGVVDVLKQAADASWEMFKSPGEGQDFRLDLPTLNGSALVWEEEVVLHLQVFAREDGTAEGRPEEARHRRPRLHRRYLHRPDPSVE